MEYFSTTSQILVVLLLALTVEAQFGNRSTQNTVALDTSLMRLHQINALIWGIFGLLIALIRLSGYDLFNEAGGKITIFVSILYLLIYLVALLTYKGASTKESKYSIAVITFVFIALLAPLGIEYINMIHFRKFDAIAVQIAGWLTTISYAIFLLSNKRKNLNKMRLLIQKGIMK